MEALRVIGVPMAEAGVAGIGRLTLSRRERMAMVEPRGTGMALFTLRAANEVRPAQFHCPEGDLDAEMVAIASAIIRQRTGEFDPSTRPRVDAKMPRRFPLAHTFNLNRKPNPSIKLYALHPPAPAALPTKAICCRIFTPALPVHPAASVRDFRSGDYT